MSRAAWESQLAGLSSWSVKSSNNKNMTVFYIWDFITSWEVNSPFPLGCSLLRNVYVLAFGSNSPSFLCLCKVQCPKQNAQAYVFCWSSLCIYTITGSSPTGRKIRVRHLSLAPRVPPAPFTAFFLLQLQSWEAHMEILWWFDSLWPKGFLPGRVFSLFYNPHG